MPPVIALAHVLAIFLLLWAAPPPVSAPVPLVMDLALIDGRQPGGGSPLGRTEPQGDPSTGDEGEASEPVEPEPAPPDEPQPSPDPQSETPPEDAQPEPAEDVADNPDVVAMVEALTGVTAEAVERRPIVSVDALLAETLSTANVAIDGAGGCDLTRRAQQRLTDDIAVTAALRRVPRDSQSVANAILLWDRNWVPASTPEAELLLNPARAAITAVVRDAPETCRIALMEGPRFIVVSKDEITHVLVMGSGRWRWDDVAAVRINPDAGPSRRARWWPFNR